ncbi:MAG: hypothetical protein DIU70_006480 [Bacillota bacterium]
MRKGILAAVLALAVAAAVAGLAFTPAYACSGASTTTDCSQSIETGK